MKTAILKKLRRSPGQFVSGQEICSSLGVTRTAVWKHICALREDGYEIESSTHKGYRLLSCPDRLTIEELLPLLTTHFIGCKVVHFDETGSTNLEAKKLAASGEAEGTVVTAEHQTQGRGRTSRQWFSAAGESVEFSLVLRPPLPPTLAAPLTQIGGAAVSLALDHFGVKSLVKWPNDVLVDGKKITGILTEMSCEMDRINSIIMGIGINVNASSYPAEVANTATSLRLVCGTEKSRCEVLAAVLNEFEPLYLDYLSRPAEPRYLKICRERSFLMGHRISFETGSGEHQAEVVGLAADGCLLVRDEHGCEQALRSGEVHIGTENVQ